jgi:hypothetical protein
MHVGCQVRSRHVTLQHKGHNGTLLQAQRRLQGRASTLLYGMFMRSLLQSA